MKVKDVPQDDNLIFDGHYKAMYAVDRHGHYTTVESSGWQAEETATQLAIAEFERELAQAYERCVAGLSAPLEYHMFARRMDVATLADSTGLAQWRVRRHLRPNNFERLSERFIQRYAQALQMPESRLRVLPIPPAR